ncbi:hypothetical protein HMI56_004381 [Coelomomyces lativittatus]|nr:hypothetical protein HMI56_004381 [Coelomomyces lativittatus]
MISKDGKFRYTPFYTCAFLLLIQWIPFVHSSIASSPISTLPATTATSFSSMSSDAASMTSVSKATHLSRVRFTMEKNIVENSWFTMKLKELASPPSSSPQPPPTPKLPRSTLSIQEPTTGGEHSNESMTQTKVLFLSSSSEELNPSSPPFPTVFKTLTFYTEHESEHKNEKVARHTLESEVSETDTVIRRHQVNKRCDACQKKKTKK